MKNVGKFKIGDKIMAMNIIREESTIEKIIFLSLSLLTAAFIIYIPFMISDKEKRQQELWQEKGCQMYDEKKISDIPAKCHSEFIDKYKSQELRTQPNE